jgi:hypothetical protein
LKSLRRGWYDSDHLIILPKASSEFDVGLDPAFIQVLHDCLSELQ